MKTIIEQIHELAEQMVSQPAVFRHWLGGGGGDDGDDGDGDDEAEKAKLDLLERACEEVGLSEEQKRAVFNEESSPYMTVDDLDAFKAVFEKLIEWEREKNN